MYSDDEIEQAVLAFLTSAATPARTEAGTRDVVAARAQVYDMIAATFMLRPDAFFSVCWMASNGLRGLVAQQRVALQEIVELAPQTSKVSTKIDGVVELRSAEAALVTLAGALAARARGAGVGVSPTVRRFNAGIESFVRRQLAPAVVVAGRVTETPEAARARIRDLWSEARARHEEILVRTQLLRDAASDLGKVQLPDLVVTSVVERARTRLNELVARFEGPEGGLAARGALLDLLAMRTLLGAATRFRVPALVRASGYLGGWTSEGLPARVVGAACAPFVYPAGTTLTLALGGVGITVSLPEPGEEGASADALLAAVARAGRVRAETLRVAHAPVAGVRDPGRARVLLHRQVEGDDLSADGKGSAWSAADLAALGVVAGMVLVVAGAAYEVRSVDRGNLVTEPALPAGGPWPYLVGRDYRGVPGGAVVTASGAAGWSRSVRVVAGGAAELEVDADMEEGAVRFSVLAERLALSAPDAAGVLEVLAGAGATALGFVPQSAAPGRQGFSTGGLDPSSVGVVAGDRLVVHGLQAPISAVEGRELRLSTPLFPPSGAMVQFTINNGVMQDYEQLRGGLSVLLGDPGLTQIEEIDAAVGRLARGARFNGEVRGRVEAYLGTLTPLQDLLDGYVVGRDAGVELIVRTLREHGFDRALDLFLTLRLAEFFALEPDGVSYKTWLVRSAATTAREVAPVGKSAQSLLSTWRTVSVRANPYEP